MDVAGHEETDFERKFSTTISNHTHCAVADAARSQLHSPELEALTLCHSLDP